MVFLRVTALRCLQLRDGSSHKGTVPSMQHNEDVVQLRFDKVGEACKANFTQPSREALT